MKTLLFLFSANVIFTIVVSQRPYYAGSQPIGYPELHPRFEDTEPENPTSTTQVSLVNRAGENGQSVTTTTMRLPVDALGQKELIDRIQTWPRDKWPFWYINYRAIEEHRQNRLGQTATGTNQMGVTNNPTGNRNEPTGTRNEPTGTRNEPTGTRNEPTGTRNEPTGTRNEPTGTRTGTTRTRNDMTWNNNDQRLRGNDQRWRGNDQTWSRNDQNRGTNLQNQNDRVVSTTRSEGSQRRL